MLRLSTLLFASSLLPRASAQIPGLTPLNAIWATPMENTESHEYDGSFLSFFETGAFVVVNLNTGARVELPKPSPTEGEFRLRAGKGWIWTEDGGWTCCDLNTGGLFSHKVRMPKEGGYIHSTADLLIQRGNGGKAEDIWEARKLQDGSSRWKVTLPGKLVTWIHSSGNLLMPDCGKEILLLDASTGRNLGRVPHTPDRELAGEAALPPRAPLPETLVLVLLPNDKSEEQGKTADVVLMDMKAGKPKWTKKVTWPAHWGEDDALRYADEISCSLVAGRIYLDCGNEEKGVRVVTLPLTGGPPSYGIVSVPGLSMRSIVSAGNWLCGIGNYPNPDPENVKDRQVVVSLDPATLKPIWVTEPLFASVTPGKQDVWSPQDGVIIAGGFPVSKSKEHMRKFEILSGVCAFKVPESKTAPPAPAAPEKK